MKNANLCKHAYDSLLMSSKSQINIFFCEVRDANFKYLRFVTGLFVVGDLAGGGLVALPTAMIQSRKDHYVE